MSVVVDLILLENSLEARRKPPETVAFFWGVYCFAAEAGTWSDVLTDINRPSPVIGA
jgi:hypothetical protein